MNKKVDKKDLNISNEDREIEKVAHPKNFSQYILLTILLLMFGFTFFSCLYYIGDYYKSRNELLKSEEIIKINKPNINALITNNGKIKKLITSSDEDKKEYKIEKINTINLKTDNESKGNGKISFNVKYSILKNTFDNNMVAKNDSDLLIRFSYSYDNENWTYLNNVISTNLGTLNPLMGNYYDIAGVVDTLNVQTNYEMSSKPGESVTLYWKCETIVSNIKENIGKEIEANFRIEY